MAYAAMWRFTDGYYRFFAVRVPRGIEVFRVRPDRDPEDRLKEKGIPAIGPPRPAVMTEIAAWLRDHPTYPLYPRNQEDYDPTTTPAP